MIVRYKICTAALFPPNADILRPKISPPYPPTKVACLSSVGTAEAGAMSSGNAGVAIIGGGPGGLAPLLAAHRRGRLAELLEAGITVVEQSDAIGAGTIGRWCINSDSTGFTFADCLAGPRNGELAALRNHTPHQQEARRSGSDDSLHLAR